MSIVPPASATLVWAFPTKFEDVRCIVWEQGSGWVIVVMFRRRDARARNGADASGDAGWRQSGVARTAVVGTWEGGGG